MNAKIVPQLRAQHSVAVHWEQKVLSVCIKTLTIEILQNVRAPACPHRMNTSIITCVCAKFDSSSCRLHHMTTFYWMTPADIRCLSNAHYKMLAIWNVSSIFSRSTQWIHSIPFICKCMMPMHLSMRCRPAVINYDQLAEQNMDTNMLESGWTSDAVG